MYRRHHLLWGLSWSPMKTDEGWLKLLHWEPVNLNHWARCDCARISLPYWSCWGVLYELWAHQLHHKSAEIITWDYRPLKYVYTVRTSLPSSRWETRAWGILNGDLGSHLSLKSSRTRPSSTRVLPHSNKSLKVEGRGDLFCNCATSHVQKCMLQT